MSYGSVLTESASSESGTDHLSLWYTNDHCNASGNSSDNSSYDNSFNSSSNSVAYPSGMSSRGMTPEQGADGSEGGDGHNSGSNSNSNNNRRQREWAQVNDWELHRDRITELYRDQGLHLKQVQKIMAEDHQFYASQRMYKTRISKWSIDKNLKAADVATLLRMQQIRAAAGKKSRFTVRGREIDFSRVDQYLKRDPTLLKRYQSGDAMDDILPGHMEAAGITCRTPSPSPPPSPLGHHAGHYYHHQSHDMHQHQHQHQQHDHLSHGSHSHMLASSGVPIVPSQAPLPVVSSSTGSFSTVSSAPFGSQSTLGANPTVLPYMPTPQHTPTHLQVPTPVYTRGLHSQAQHDYHSAESRRNSMPVIAGQTQQQHMGGASSVPSVSPYQTSFPSTVSGSSTASRQLSVVSSTAEDQLKESLISLTREYVMGAFQRGLWMPSGRPGAPNYTYTSTIAEPGSADRLYGWGHEMRASRRLIAGGIFDEGFHRVHCGMDELRQHMHDEDPSLLFYLLYSTTFGTPDGAIMPSTAGAATSELRQLATTLCSHVLSLARIVLGPSHPITRMFQLLEPVLMTDAHLAALPLPLTIMRDMFAERDPTAIDPAAAPMCRRLAYLLRCSNGTDSGHVGNVATYFPRSLSPRASGHGAAPTGSLTPDSHRELEELIRTLQGAQNTHTKLQFYATYLEYLSEIALLERKSSIASSDVPTATSNWNETEPAGMAGMASTTTHTPAATFTTAYSGAADSATQESAYTTATARGRSVGGSLGGSAGSVGSSADQLHGHGSDEHNMHAMHHNKTIAPMLTTNNAPMPSLATGRMPGSSAAVMPTHATSIAPASSSMAAMVPSHTMTPRTVVAGHHGSPYQPPHRHSQHHHYSHHGHTQYPLQQSYPPVPQPYHAPSTPGMPDPDSMSWELEDVANLDWM